MLAAARRQGALALPTPGDLAGLLSVVTAGRPVVVLQNLGLAWAPRWHYAVVIGYDLPRRQVFLRSGITRREVMSLRTFDYTWARSGRWGMMVSPPGELPASAAQSDVELALAALERFSSAPTMITHYQTAAHRWPDSLLLRIGLGNAYARAQQLDAAEQAFRGAAEGHPRSAIVLNNLASVLQARGKWDEALRTADRALEAAIGSEWQGHAQATRDEIRAAIRASAPSSH
jgi:tetratricopeptide (TPR) repeat protein